MKKIASRSKKVIETRESKERAPFTCTSAKECFEHFSPAARSVPEDTLEPCRLDVEIVRANASRGVEAIRPHLAVVRRRLPECAVPDILEVHELSLALMFAAGKVIRSSSNGDIDDRLAAVRPMREATLRQLEVFAILGILPKAVPASIRAGFGALDTARDAQAIVGVFHDHQATFDGKHPFTAAQLKRLGEDGDWLVSALKPAMAKGTPVERDPAAVLRDQLFALLSERHEQLRHAGVVVFGLKDLDARIPPLGARIGSARQPASSEKSAPLDAAPAGK